MCGIAGYIYLKASGEEFSKQEDHIAEIRRMTDAIAHRGPDGEGAFEKFPVCLGHRRLSIIDLSHEADQPMFSEDGRLAIVFNGEIYNYIEIRNTLLAKGYTFRTTCDTEVILYAYQEWGEECVQQFNGMWAFALYDFHEKKMLLSRDRLGVKPLFYYNDGERLFFSSEIKSILSVNSLHKANKTKLFEYIAYGYRTSDGNTCFEEVSELQPGHTMLIRLNESPEIYQFWKLEFDKYSFKNKSTTEIYEEFTELFNSAVSLRFRSDVPVAVLLSGGLDSTAIAQTVNELIDTGDIAQQNFYAFTASFPNYKYDESAIATEVANRLKHCKLLKITPHAEQLADDFKKIMYGFGEPVASSSSFAHYQLMKNIHAHGIKVVLNGQGSDEAFYGYDRYIIGYYLIDILFKKPQQFARQASEFSKKTGFSAKYITTQIAKALMPRRTASRLRASRQEHSFDVLKTEFIDENYKNFPNKSFVSAGGNVLKDYSQWTIEFQNFASILHYEDHSAMQSSIEMRSPFVDYRLMEFAFALPEEHKLDNGVTKKIIRETVGKKLPSSVVNNYKKIGFRTPFDQWMQDASMQQFIGEITSTEQFKTRSLWNSEKLANILQGEGKQYAQFPTWRFINAELWMQTFGISNMNQ